jgi:ankyrin repeat protein
MPPPGRDRSKSLRLLLNAGAEVNSSSHNERYGTTPLHATAHGNQRSVAELLLSFWADLSVRNLHNRTPLQETAIHNATAVARLLRENGAKE